MDFIVYSICVSLVEYPRITEQSKQRKSLLAGLQVANSWSREEMADYFHLLAEAKTNGFSTIEEYLTYKSNQVPGNEEVHFSHWDQVAKSLFPKR